MRVIIAGPRDLGIGIWEVGEAIRNSGFAPSVIMSGDAQGVDAAADMYASELEYTYEKYPALWNKHGKAAGPIRNQEMAEYADALIVIKRPGPTTRGTASMIREAEKRNLPIHVEEVGA